MYPLAASLDHRFSTPFSAGTTLSAREERFYSFQGSITSNRIFLNNCTIFLQNPGANRIIFSFTIAVTVLFIVSITQILLLKQFTTYTFVPSGVATTPVGPFPTFTWAVHYFWLCQLQRQCRNQQSLSLSHIPLIRQGDCIYIRRSPIFTVAITVLVVVLITETMTILPQFEIYAYSLHLRYYQHQNHSC